MQPEKINYLYDFPINISIVNVDEYPLHFHQDVEIVYVLENEIELKNGCCDYILPEGSVFINNGREVHGLYRTDKPNIVAIMHINNLHFTKYYPALSLSSYRTYTPQETDGRFVRLRKTLLTLFLTYLKKGVDYKQECIDSTMGLIDFLNRNFNFLAIENGLAVSPHYDDLALIERMTRIIPYMYEHHSEKISLKELAEMEHLSTFYISHMIKTCTGLSFRDFLCFARVEFSERLLLDDNSKVHIVGKQVGFSTTAYYEKFFKHWFGLTPEEHKRKFLPLVKSDMRPQRTEPVHVNTAIAVVKQCLPSIDTQADRRLQVKSLKLDLNIDANQSANRVINPELLAELSADDYKKTEDEIFSVLEQLRVKTVLLKCGRADDAEEWSAIRDIFEKKGMSVSAEEEDNAHKNPSFGLDTIANLVEIFRKNLSGTSPLRVKLRDAGSGRELLKGDSGLLTASGVRKPAFYGCLALSMMRGQLLLQGEQYAVLKTHGKTPAYIVAAFNHDCATEQICAEGTSLHEAKDVLDNFNNEIEVNVNITNLHGKFFIKKYCFEHSIFDYMAKLGFPAEYDSRFDIDLNYYSMPHMDVMTETVSDVLNLNFMIKGVGLQMAVIESTDGNI
jgi:AraC-like DNA-binding protein